jgi:hypothetical protein
MCSLLFPYLFLLYLICVISFIDLGPCCEQIYCHFCICRMWGMCRDSASSVMIQRWSCVRILAVCIDTKSGIWTDSNTSVSVQRFCQFCNDTKMELCTDTGSSVFTESGSGAEIFLFSIYSIECGSY